MMITSLRFLRRNMARLVAITLILTFYGFAQLPDLSDTERAELATRFRFIQSPLPEVAGHSLQFVRTVSPNLAHISAWISSVGASVALNDLDSDGLPNDLCYVDVRIDQVIVAPVPGTPARYSPFVLNPAPLLFDQTTMAPMGCLPGDLNEDGLIDLIIYYWGRTPIAFLRRRDTAPDNPVLKSDSYVRYEVVPTGGRWYTNAATRADVDGDGHIDLVIGNYFQDGARILEAKMPSLEHMQHSMSRAFNGGRNRLLLWTGSTAGAHPTIRFKEIQGIMDSQTAHGWTLAVGAADLDGDLLPEIYFANDFGPDRLLHNRSKPGNPRFGLLHGKKTFATPNSKVLGRDSFKGMGVDFGDLNGDGLLDIYVSNIATEYALEESHFAFLSSGSLKLMQDGVAPYVERSEPLGLSRSGWAWETRLGDFDNDGILEALQATGFVKGLVDRWPELHELAMANDNLLRYPGSWPRLQPGDDLSGYQSNAFFVRADDGRYYDIAPELGLDDSKVSRGIATADVDGDGDLDFAVANQWDRSVFYRNESPNPGAFLGLHLFLRLRPETPARTSVHLGHPGDGSPGRPAIGASATVYLPDEYCRLAQTNRRQGHTEWHNPDLKLGISDIFLPDLRHTLGVPTGRSPELYNDFRGTPHKRCLVAQVDGGNGHSGTRSPHLHFGLGNFPLNRFPVLLRWRNPDGHVEQQMIYLGPGWHTVLLAWPTPEES